MSQISELEFYRKHVDLEKNGDSFKIIKVKATIHGDVEGDIEGVVFGKVEAVYEIKRKEDG